MVNGRAGALRKGRCLTVASAENCPLMGGRDVRDQAYQRVEDSGYTVWEGHGTQIERPEEVQNYGTHMIAKYSAEQQVRLGVDSDGVPTGIGAPGQRRATAKGAALLASRLGLEKQVYFLAGCGLAVSLMLAWVRREHSAQCRHTRRR